MHIIAFKVPENLLCAASIGQLSEFPQSRQIPSILHTSITKVSLILGVHNIRRVCSSIRGDRRKSECEIEKLPKRKN
jgi:hypothetical protein